MVAKVTITNYCSCKGCAFRVRWSLTVNLKLHSNNNLDKNLDAYNMYPIPRLQTSENLTMSEAWLYPFQLSSANV